MTNYEAFVESLDDDERALLDAARILLRKHVEGHPCFRSIHSEEEVAIVLDTVRAIQRHREAKREHFRKWHT